MKIESLSEMIICSTRSEIEKRGILMIRLHNDLHRYSSSYVYVYIYTHILQFDVIGLRVASVLMIRSKFGIMEKSGKEGPA